jgi:KAP-like P-loop domain-containing protein
MAKMDSKSGYDASQFKREDDDLKRWRFASEIVDVISATPPDWSVRIGVFGKWGEGKTTVLRFAEQMLKEKKNIVFDFNPWAIQNWNDLWDSFGTRLVDALTAAQIDVGEQLKRVSRGVGGWLHKKGADKALEVAATVLNRDKLYNAAFATLQNSLRYDSTEIKKIQQKLHGRRVVVLLDDLDRTAPDLIPQLLLSLRELFDLPGFTFVLAFDDEIVGDALLLKNPAWLSGSSFLEKILDFRFHLPPITDAQKHRLIHRALEKYCPFVPRESVTKIQDLLPNNPRKLKSLIRSLAALKPQIARHNPDEFSWTDMWLAQMVRLESHSFFELLLTTDALDKETGLGYAFRQEMRRRHQDNNEEEEENQSLKELLKRAGVDDPATESRIIQLMEAVRTRASISFRYSCELAERPHAVTWKEFDLLQKIWQLDPNPKTLANWIAEHATKRSIDSDDVETDLFESIVNRRSQRLQEAADTEFAQEHEAKIKEAGVLLDLAEQFLLGLQRLTGARFNKFYDQAFYWFEFRTNPVDQLLREQEKTFLLNLLSKSPEALAQELLEVLHPWGFSKFDLDNASTSDAKKALQKDLAAVLAPRVAGQGIELMQQNDGIRALREMEKFLALKYGLLHPDSPLWRTSLWQKLVREIRKGQKSLVAFRNSRDLLELIVEGLERKLDLPIYAGGTTIVANREFIGELWKTVISRQIQFRLQIRFIQWRQVLLQAGVPELVLPLTAELKSRWEIEKLTQNSPIQVD